MNLQSSKFVVGFFSAVFGMLLSAGGYSATSQDDLLDLLPANTLICFRVNNFTGSLEKLDQYLAGVSPMPVSMMFTMFLGGALGDPMLTGINKYGTIAAAVLPKGTDEDAEMVILLPVTDSKTYISSPYCQGADENGIYTLSAPGSSTGQLAFLPLENSDYLLLGPNGQKDALLFARTVFQEKKQSLSARLNSEDARNASSAPAWLWLNIEEGYTRFGPDLKGGIQEALRVAAEMDKAMPFKPEAISAMLDGVDAWMVQWDSLSVMLTPAGDQLTMEILVAARADSELAQMLVRDPTMKQGFSMGGYLDAEAPINALMVMNKPLMDRANESFVEILTAFAGEKGLLLRSRFEAVTTKIRKALGEEAAFSFGYAAGAPPFTFREAFEITDAAVMREMMGDGWGLANELYGIFGIPARFTLQEKTAQYKGVSIDRAVIQFILPETASEQDRQAMEVMYGKDGLAYPYAVTNQRMFVAMGRQSEEAIEKMIDLPADAPAPAEMQAAMKVMPNAQTADAIVSLNLLRWMKGFAEMMQSMESYNPSVSMPSVFEIMQTIPVQSQSAMAVGVWVDGGRIRTHLVLPKQHLMEIMSWSMQIQQKMMMQQFQQPPSAIPPTQSSGPADSPL